jgi:hypothetical protein
MICLPLSLEQKNKKGAGLYMRRSRALKIGFDLAILFCVVGLSFLLIYQGNPSLWAQVIIIIFGLFAAADLIALLGARNSVKEFQTSPGSDSLKTDQLVLLDERDKPLKSWDLAGRTALIIGKKNDNEDVDVDLTECEYNTFIDELHGVLNYCLDSWYLEDLGSKNGIKIKKVEDGGCYKVTNRPCKVSAGDVIYVANTRLLLT